MGLLRKLHLDDFYSVVHEYGLKGRWPASVVSSLPYIWQANKVDDFTLGHQLKSSEGSDQSRICEVGVKDCRISVWNFSKVGTQDRRHRKNDQH